jgi:hypothetical protein
MVFEHWEQIETGLCALERHIRETIDAPYKQPNWDALNYSYQGVHVLFDEFKRVAAQADYFSSKLEIIQVGVVRTKYNINEIDIGFTSLVDDELRKQAKGWLLTGYAQNERQKLAQLSVSGDITALNRIRNHLQLLDDLIAIIQNRIKKLESFKYSAQTLEKILNFAHALQELEPTMRSRI